MAQNFPINGDKLKRLVVDKFGSLLAAGEKIGYSKSSLQNPCARAEISRPIMIAVESILGIPYSEYSAEVPTPATKRIYPKSVSAGCDFCNRSEELVKNDDRSFSLTTLILGNDLFSTVYVDNGEVRTAVLTGYAHINYCPMCGRKVG